MRPGPIRPGDVDEGERVLRMVSRASMRPGPIRPGDMEHRRQPDYVMTGFNEARADSPGRCGTKSVVAIYPPEASMRPGPIRPGDSYIAWMDRARLEAQLQ